jgi:hypothetical protein
VLKCVAITYELQDRGTAMERRNNVHKYQTYFQARVVYLADNSGQQLLLIKTGPTRAFVSTS